MMFIKILFISSIIIGIIGIILAICLLGFTTNAIFPIMLSLGAIVYSIWAYSIIKKYRDDNF